jgi:hypothetical protein
MLVLFKTLGQKDLCAVRITTKDSNVSIQKITVEFPEMHYYDQLKCYARDAVTVECLFVGRKIKIAKFTIKGSMASLKDAPEEYYAYKNIEPIEVDFNEQMVIVSGWRVANEHEKDTFDHAGVFIYNRITSQGGSSYVRHLISKDEIFDLTSSNEYRVVLSGSQVMIYGSLSNSVAVFNVSRYSLEGKFI